MKAAVALHNFLMVLEEKKPKTESPYRTLSSEDRRLITEVIRDVAPKLPPNVDETVYRVQSPAEVREIFAEYF